MRAIVTRGAGFIGSHVVDALMARGDDVRVLDVARSKRELGWRAEVGLEDGLRRTWESLAGAEP